MRNWPQVFLLSTAIAITGCFGGGESRESDTRAIGAQAPQAKKKPPRQKSPGSATLSWYPPTENEDGSYLDNLAGYRIYYGTSANRLDRTITIDNPGLTRYVVENLPPAKWHFAMTSVNTRGVEGKRSQPVSKKVS